MQTRARVRAAAARLARAVCLVACLATAGVAGALEPAELLTQIRSPKLALDDYRSAEKKLGDNATLENDKGLAFSALDDRIEAYRAFSRAMRTPERIEPPFS